MSQQGRLDDWTGRVSLPRPANWNIVQRVKDAASRLAWNIGLDLDLLGARSTDLDDSTGVMRWQYTTIYEYVEDANEYGQIQFRTFFYSLRPAEGQVYEYLRNVHHDRLHTVFDTAPKYEGYIQGFNPYAKLTAEEAPEDNVVPVSELPASGLGVPRWEVEIYDADDSLVGHASGYSLDFGTEEVVTGRPPDNEVWKVGSFNASRGDYQINPPGGGDARERAYGKLVILNGFPIGTVVKGGRVWLSKTHQRPNAAKYRARDYLIENSGAPYQALSPGAKLYKVYEDEGTVLLSTVEPRGFDPIDPADIDPTATGVEETVLSMNPEQPTEFVVLEDEATPWALGKYNPPISRRITEQTEFSLAEPSRR